MGLKPWELGALSIPEFNLMHEGFKRAENRMRALLIEHALMTGNIQKQKRSQVERTIHALRQYPVKKWLKSR